MPTPREASQAREAAKRASQIPRAAPDRFPLAKAAPAAKSGAPAAPVPAIEDVPRRDDWGVPPDWEVEARAGTTTAEWKLQQSKTYDGIIKGNTGSKLFIQPNYDWWTSSLDVIANASCFQDYTGEGARIGTHVKFTMSAEEPEWSDRYRTWRFASVCVWTGDAGPTDDPESPSPGPERTHPAKKKLSDKEARAKKKPIDKEAKPKMKLIDKEAKKKKKPIDKEANAERRRAGQLGTAGKLGRAGKLGSGKLERSSERGSKRGRAERSGERSSKSKRKRKRTLSSEEEEEADSESESSLSEEEPETRRTKVRAGRRPQAISPRDH